MGGNGQEDYKQDKTNDLRHEQGWQEFHDLITAPERHRLDALTRRLDNPVQRAEEISKVLPEALSVAGNDRIARTLQPTIDKALKASVRKNPKALADAIYPALGPAIRKAIVSTLMSMVQSLNQMLNHSLSWRGLRWRLEALRTKRSFGEVVLLHTLVFRVEQLFVIHRKTGLVLQHVTADVTLQRDPDLISSMLTAIQDFVHDSFNPETSERLDTLRMGGDHSVWIEHGAEAILAAVIRGTPPVGLRQTFRRVIDELHGKYSELLSEFDGDITPFSMIRPDLEDVLTFQARENPMRISPLMWCGLLLLSFGVGFWVWTTYQAQRQWQSYLDHLENLPGIMIQDAGKRGRSYFIQGMKDPLAADPAELLNTTTLDPKKIQFRWAPYYSLQHGLVFKRALRRLHPPETVRLKLEDGILVASGKAPHRWVNAFREKGLAVPGVTGLDLDSLEDIETTELKNALFDLEGRAIYFEQARSVIDQSQIRHLESILAILQRLQTLQYVLDRPVRLAVIGHADPSGPALFNQKLSLDRALTVQRWFLQRGIDPLMLMPVGGGIYTTRGGEVLPENLQPDRRVIFKPGALGGQAQYVD